MSRSTRLTCIVVLGGALFLTGCTSGEPASKTPIAQTSVSAAPPVRVVVPGRPGESARVTDSDKIQGPPKATFNTIDVTFAQMMIVHHAQALEMADLAPQRAGNTTLRALAERISAAQKPEMAWLKRWLSERKQSESAPGHDHGSMPGMQSPADMAALAAARGADFDRRFVTMMVAHHRGAIQMTGDVVQGGSDEVLREVAGEMSVEQGSEINRLLELAPKP